MLFEQTRWEKLRRWRIALDRAWRSPDMRHEFEAELGFEPLAEDRVDRAIQADVGYVTTYERNFRTWAADRLKLEDFDAEVLPLAAKR